MPTVVKLFPRFTCEISQHPCVAPWHRSFLFQRFHLNVSYKKKAFPHPSNIWSYLHSFLITAASVPTIRNAFRVLVLLATFFTCTLVPVVNVHFWPLLHLMLKDLRSLVGPVSFIQINALVPNEEAPAWKDGAVASPSTHMYDSEGLTACSGLITNT